MQTNDEGEEEGGGEVSEEEEDDDISSDQMIKVSFFFSKEKMWFFLCIKNMLFFLSKKHWLCFHFSNKRKFDFFRLKTPPRNQLLVKNLKPPRSLKNQRNRRNRRRVINIRYMLRYFIYICTSNLIKNKISKFIKYFLGTPGIPQCS